MAGLGVFFGGMAGFGIFFGGMAGFKFWRDAGFAIFFGGMAGFGIFLAGCGICQYFLAGCGICQDFLAGWRDSNFGGIRDLPFFLAGWRDWVPPSGAPSRGPSRVKCATHFFITIIYFFVPVILNKSAI